MLDPELLHHLAELRYIYIYLPVLYPGKQEEACEGQALALRLR